ncbi:MAG: hypothetical protein IJX87_01415 [Clostridia bacterium]|nr:hypothetical protein [Clostridia bacterium]
MSENKNEKREEVKQEETRAKSRDFYDSTMPQTLHCRKCRTEMKDGVCPTCGFKMYVPMDPKKRDKIRLILTAVMIAAFVVIFVAMQIAKS